MRTGVRILFYLAFPVLIGASTVGDIAAQGKGKGGDRGGGGDRRGGGQGQISRPQAPQRQMQQIQRSQPQMQRREMPQFERQQMPQWNRQAQRQERPRIERQQMPQWNRQAQRQERPRIERQQMPQWNRQAERQERPRFQRPQFERRQMPEMDRRAQRQERPRFERPQFERRQAPQWNRQAPQMNRQAQRQERQRVERPQFERRQMTQMNRQAQRQERQRFERPQMQRPQVERRQMPQWDRQAQRQDRPRFDRQQSPGGDRQQQVWQQGRGDLSGLSDTRIRGNGWRGNRGDGRQQSLLAQDFDRRWRGGDVNLNTVNIAPFRERAREFRRQARSEGWTFDERDFRRNVWEFNQREAWRDDVLRTAISVDLGWSNDYQSIAPPAYPVYYGVNYEPWHYNIGYTYYDPSYSSFHVEPYYHAYRPYDYYYSSYYYDDPYYLDDPFDDFLTVRIFASNGPRYTSRFVRALLANGYEQGYRDGLLARENGYYDSSYDDPYLYYDEDLQYEETTYVTYEPIYYSAYEDRRCLSEGYELGYRDALYADDDYYDPYENARNIDMVSIFVGVTWQI